MVILKKIFDTPFVLVGGYIKKVSDGTGAAAGRLVTLTMDDGLQVTFWDSKNQNLCTRIRQAQVKAGSFISILVLYKDDEKRTATAVNFKYSGVWDFKAKPPTNTHKGEVMDIIDEGEKITLVLNDGQCFDFDNFEKGYQMANRLRKKVALDIPIEIATTDNKVTNFKINDKWELTKSVSAIIGQVRFIDEGTSFGRPYVKTKVGFYEGKDKNGNNVYAAKSIYFTDDNNKDMISAVKEKLPPKTQTAIVGVSSGNDNYEGYYFLPFNK